MDGHGQRDLNRFALICPVCGSPLKAGEKTLSCLNKHNFDLSRKGAVNLLRSSGKGKHHGDDKIMVHARTSFLSKGYYDPLSGAVDELLLPNLHTGSTVIDAGCGEGKYTEDLLLASRRNGKDLLLLGIDISKDAVSALRGRSKEISGVVASTSSMPLMAGCADAVMCIFSPLFPEEFSRILRQGGLFLHVVPLERHLLELKEMVYDHAYLNPPPVNSLEGFKLICRKDLIYRIHLQNREDITALFQMTPYNYKTGRNDQSKLDSLNELDVTLAFGLFLYQKEGRI